jgi:hypothetical protein
MCALELSQACEEEQEQEKKKIWGDQTRTGIV